MLGSNLYSMYLRVYSNSQRVCARINVPWHFRIFSTSRTSKTSTSQFSTRLKKKIRQHAARSSHSLLKLFFEKTVHCEKSRHPSFVHPMTLQMTTNALKNHIIKNILTMHLTPLRASATCHRVNGAIQSIEWKNGLRDTFIFCGGLGHTFKDGAAQEEIFSAG